MGLVFVTLRATRTHSKVKVESSGSGHWEDYQGWDAILLCTSRWQCCLFWQTHWCQAVGSKKLINSKFFWVKIASYPLPKTVTCDDRQCFMLCMTTHNMVATIVGLVKSLYVLNPVLGEWSYQHLPKAEEEKTEDGRKAKLREFTVTNKLTIYRNLKPRLMRITVQTCHIIMSWQVK